MPSHITTQQYYVTLKVFKLENTKYPDTKTQTYFSSLFGTNEQRDLQMFALQMLIFTTTALQIRKDELFSK